MRIQRIASRAGVPLLSLFLLAGCRSPHVEPSVNLSEPGWRIQRGQAVWKRDATSPEVAGELVVATHRDGRSMIEFTKTPLPVLFGIVEAHAWQIRWAMENRKYAGRGVPPKQLLWLQLPAALKGETPPDNVQFHTTPPDRWVLENPTTQERVEGYLQPRLHRIESGDTFAGLAGRFGITVAALESANPDFARKPLHPGEIILVPLAASP